MDAVVREHGLPRVIVSNRDTKFMSSFWREVCKVMGTTLAMSSGFHPPDRWTDREGKLGPLKRCCGHTWVSARTIGMIG